MISELWIKIKMEQQYMINYKTFFKKFYDPKCFYINTLQITINSNKHIIILYII